MFPVIFKKIYSGNFAFFIHIILELFAHEFCIFLKKVAYLFAYSIASVCLQANILLFENAHIPKTENCFNVKPFYMKVIISIDLEICISVPLK